MRVAVWYVHGGYGNALLRGRHDYLVPERGLAGESTTPTAPWPTGVRLTRDTELRADRPDVVVLQRLEELASCRDRFGWEPGRDVPAIFLEHNTPRGRVPDTRHPLADVPGFTVVHVTPFNALVWDTGRTPTVVVEHGLPEPGQPWTGELDRAAFVANEPVRRLRTVGADLLPTVAGAIGVDAYGIDADMLVDRTRLTDPGTDLAFGGNLDPGQLSARLARHRAYLHLTRWTSLGLSLLESMHLGMPCVVLATTEAATLPDEIGAVSTDPVVLRRRLAQLVADPDLARDCGLGRGRSPGPGSGWTGSSLTGTRRTRTPGPALDVPRRTRLHCWPNQHPSKETRCPGPWPGSERSRWRP